MASTYSTNKNLELPGNGDYVNTWNIPVNADMTVIDNALGGTTSLNATSGSVTLTATQYQKLILAITGSISANVTFTIPSGVGGQWIVRNTTTDASGGPWSIIIASAGGGASQTVERGTSSLVYSDGTNVYLADSRTVTAAGSNTQIQYNNGGLLGASSTFVYDGGVGIGYTTSGSVGSGGLAVSGNVSIGSSAAPAVKLVVSSTDAVQMPIGTTAQRPTGAAGMLRFNSTTVAFDGYDGTQWGPIPGATGGGTDKAFYLNDTTITTNYTVPSGKNAGTFGPVTIAVGVTVTVSSGSYWDIV